MNGFIWHLLILIGFQVFGTSKGQACDSSPCKNGALCEPRGEGYSCFCVDGYTGPKCDINFDDCLSAPCRNNATCIDGVATYTCACAPGFTGSNCQEDVDDCISSPCKRNGTCIDVVNGYACECMEPFRGDNCDLFPCETVPCDNGGVCSNDVSFNQTVIGFVCDCPIGFTGERCEIDIPDCDPDSPCHGNGMCVDGINDFSCLCEPGWVGDRCQSPVDDCIGNGCRNDANCTDMHLGYFCNCQPGYEGAYCERERDECEVYKPCQNGAACVDLFDDYLCECSTGWHGINCTEQVNECRTSPCQNGATCIDLVGDFQCRCAPFYTGSLCETLYNPCGPEYNPCENGATCVVPPDGQYRCFCAKGFAGVHCEVDVNECLSQPCENNGTCEDVTSSYMCHCMLGWTGNDCEQNIDDCIPQPCFNDATCLDLLNGFECSCSLEYTGRLCEEMTKYCLENSCLNGGTCINVLGGYECLCAQSYTDPRCSSLIDACRSEPCINNGTCLNTANGAVCSCPFPLTGLTCEDLIDFCESDPCLNGGTCHRLLDGYVCVCAQFLTGKQCTDIVDYCKDEPCQNGAYCINDASNYRCSCLYGYTGVTCEDMIDFCSQQPCLNSANCSNIPGGFRCDCLKGYEDDLCQTIIIVPSFSSTSLSLTSATSMTYSTVSISSPWYSEELNTVLSSYSQTSSSSTFSTIQLSQSYSFIHSISFSPIYSSSIKSSISSAPISVTGHSSRHKILTPSSTFNLFSNEGSNTFTHESSLSQIVMATSPIQLSSIQSSNSLAPISVTGHYRISDIPTPSSTSHLFSSERSIAFTQEYPLSEKVMATSTLGTPYQMSSSVTATEITKTSLSSSVVKLNSTSAGNGILKTVISSSSNEIKTSQASSVTDVATRNESRSPNLTTLIPSSSLTATISTQQTQMSPLITITPTSYISRTSLESSKSSFLSLHPSTERLTTSSLTTTPDVITTLHSTVPPTSSNFIVLSSNIIFTVSKYVTSFLLENQTSTSTPSIFISSDSWSTNGASELTVISYSYSSSSMTLSTSMKDGAFSTVSTGITYFDKMSSSHIATTVHLFSSTSTVYPSYSKISDTPIPDKSFSQATVSLTSFELSAISSSEVRNTAEPPLISRLSATSSLLSIVSTQIFEYRSMSSYSSIIYKLSSSSMMHDITSTYIISKLSHQSVSTMSSIALYTTRSLTFPSSLTSLMPNLSTYAADSKTLVSKTSFTPALIVSSHVSLLSSEFSDTKSAMSHSTIVPSLSYYVSLNTEYTTIYSSNSNIRSYSASASLLMSTSQTSHTSFSNITQSLINSTPFVPTSSINFIASTSNSKATSDLSLISSSSTFVSKTTSEFKTEIHTSHSIQTSLQFETPTEPSSSSTAYSTFPLITSTYLNKSLALRTMSLVGSTLQSSSIYNTHLSISTSFTSAKHTATVSPSSGQLVTKSVKISILSKPMTTTMDLQESMYTTKERSSQTTDKITEIVSTKSSVKHIAILSTNSLELLATSTNISIITNSMKSSADIKGSIATTNEVSLQTAVTSTVLMTSTIKTSLFSSFPPVSSVSILPFSTPVYTQSAIFTTTTFISTGHLIMSTPSSYLLLTTAPESSSIVVVSSTLPHSSSTTTMLPVNITTTPAPSISCSSINCFNNGTCREDRLGLYCDCRHGFVGRFCETKTLVCDTFMCENGGYCSVTMTTYGYQIPRCNCPIPFTGTRCHIELLIYFPSFLGVSYMEFQQPEFTTDQSNEINLSLKTTHADGTVLFAANQNQGYTRTSYIWLRLANGRLIYEFSCDGIANGAIDGKRFIDTGDVYEITIRQVWSAGPGHWCTAALATDGQWFVSRPLLSLGPPQTLGKLYLGGVPRYSLINDVISVMDGFVGCVRSLQVNQREINMVTMAIRNVNIENCNVPVCQHSPCRNQGTCHSAGEEWFCSCPRDYAGVFCERRLCHNDPCQHGGTCVILETERDQLCVCPYGRGGVLCETELVVTVPHYTGTQFGHTSYSAYTRPHFMTDSFAMEFYMVLDDNSIDSNLVMYMGNTGPYGTTKDFLAVGLYRGYMLFRFDLGSGYGEVYSPFPLNLSIPHHLVQLGRTGTSGWLQVDNQRNVTGRSRGPLTALNTKSMLYVGGYPNEVRDLVTEQARFEDGLKGCIYQLRIRNHGSEFIEPGSPPGHVEEGRNVGQCTRASCQDDPCHNEAECLDLGASIFCNCSDGWKGALCLDLETVCDVTNSCDDGSTCLPVLPESYKCLCQLGKRGKYCKEDFSISDPLFPDEKSFMSLEPVYLRRNVDVMIQLTSYKSDGLVFYVSQHLHNVAGDFLAVTLYDWKVQLRFDVGSGVNILTSEASISNGTWSNIQVGRNSTYSYLTVNGHTIVAMTTGMMSFLDTTTEFYIGGVPSLSDVSPNAVQNEPSGFRGCIRDFIVNGHQYELTEIGAVSGRNIQDCDGTSCGYHVCRNGGTCTSGEDGDFTCLCPKEFFGKRCEHPDQCRNNTCLHGNCRVTDETSHVCDCFTGWSGSSCDQDHVIGISARLSRHSFLVLKDQKYEARNSSYTRLTLTFKTRALHALLLWHGQTYSEDEDYLGIGLLDGRAKVVWNLGWYSSSDVLTALRYNDGNWHTLSIEIKVRDLVLTIDGSTYTSTVSGDFQDLDTHGSYYIGGFKSGSVKESTMEFFTEPLDGCIKDIRLHDEEEFVLDHADDGINVQKCL